MSDPQEEQKGWALYGDAASSLTRLYQHSVQQKRDAYNAGFKAALEAVLAHAVKECTDTQSNTICAASLINFILPQLNRDASDGRTASQGAPTTSPSPSGSNSTAQHGVPQARGDATCAQQAAAFGAPTVQPVADGRASHSPWPSHAGSAHTASAQGPATAQAAGFVYGATPALAGGGGANAGGLVRKRSADQTADWMDGGATGAGVIQPFGQLPPEWPPLWSKRGRH